MLAACGDSTCPAGTIAVENRCELETPSADAGEAGSSGGTGGTSGGTGGTSGAGSGGSGGSPAVDCEDDSDCSPMTPQCNAAGDCISCTSNTACEDRGPLAHCEMTLGSVRRGQCVECLDDDHCEGNDQGDYCLNNTCVPCKTNAHCTDLTKPQCSPEGQCVGCTDSDACEGRDGTEICQTTAGPKRGHCIGCIDHADCENPTPECANNECKPCTGNDACEDRDGTTVCDTSNDTTFGGTCVQCTGSNYEACGAAPNDTPYVCDALERTCSDKLQGSAQPCAACIADAHCRTGTACMQTRFGSADTGNYCLWKQDAAGAGAPNGSCLNTRTFVSSESSWVTIDGSAAEVCKPRTTTCQGLNHFSAQSCSGPTAEGHAQCGAEGVSDAYCGPFADRYFCTVPCISADDCQNTRSAEPEDECATQMIGEQSLDSCRFE